MELETVQLHIIDNVAHVILNRPEKRNAFNSQMIMDLTDAFRTLAEHSCRSIVLTGEGSTFSAGADLDYMSEMREASHQDNLKDAMRLADLLELIYTHPKPVIARVNGPVVGGGNGLVAACDIAVAKKGSFFAFSEVRLGITPATISPYVIRRIGEGRARLLMLTGERFTADQALEYGLVHRVAVMGDLEHAVHGYTTALSLGGPKALEECKKLIQKVGEEPLDSVKNYTAEMIADLRVSEEGQEGMGSYLDRRDPEWQKG
ncbi:MAG: enoyl-CoA hydratase-related protein [Candidatus Electryonea clarkiae]|nr:enoyl-CoA hydratase-related protein [Candidatus Electryonea clarkiae]MDP8286488.1 enoyl-CoA hydratase-related protein [Candidatus Electryonea clarkiae]